MTSSGPQVASCSRDEAPYQQEETVSLISIRIGPTTDPESVTRPDRGRTANPMAGGPPSRSATIKGRVGAGARMTKFAVCLRTHLKP
jgi:hypothetical protein